MAKDYDDKHRYMVAHFIGEVKTGDRFDPWPRHITLHPWFNAIEVSALHKFLLARDIIERYPIDRTEHKLGEVALFGPEGEVRVRKLVHSSAGLGFIHGVLVTCLNEFGADPTWMGGAFNPHESEVDGVDYDDPSQLIVVDSMCLIRRDEDRKTIIAAEIFKG